MENDNAVTTDVSVQEKEQLQRLDTYRKLVQSIVIKYIPVLAVIFMIVAFITLYTLKQYVEMSPFRFETSTDLLYYPKESDKIKTIDTMQCRQIFCRAYMFKKLSDEMTLSDEDKSTLHDHIIISNDRRQPNLFHITAFAHTSKEAVRYVNTFADLCIREYIVFREADLQRWSDIIEQRRMELNRNLEKTEIDEAALIQEAGGILNMDKEAERLRAQVETSRNSLSNMNVQLSDMEATRKKLELLLENVNPAILLHIPKLRSFIKNIQRLDDELLVQRQLYTENNPRLVATEAQRKIIADDYEQFLKENHIEYVNAESLDLIEKTNDDLKKVITKYESLRENSLATAHEIEASNQIIEKLSTILPKRSQIINQRTVLQQSLLDLEQTVSEINYLKASMKNDLYQMEVATDASGKPSITKQSLIVSCFVGGVIAGMVALLLVGLELIFGRVKNTKELLFHSDFTTLGAIPKNIAEDTDDNKIVLDTLFYNFDKAEVHNQLIASICLKGAVLPESLIDSFEWNYAISGRKIIFVHVVKAATFDEQKLIPDGLQMSAVIYSGTHGYMPVENPSVLTSSEIMLLNCDLLELKEKYAKVVILRDEQVSSSEAYVSQITDLAEGILLYVAAKRTSRMQLNTMKDIQRRKQKPMAVVATNTNVAHNYY